MRTGKIDWARFAEPGLCACPSLALGLEGHSDGTNRTR
jgi:hypothetical protein